MPSEPGRSDSWRKGLEFVENRALQGGAIAIGDSGSPIVTHCTFRGNQATLEAGVQLTGVPVSEPPKFPVTFH